MWADASNQIGTTNPLEMLMAGTYSVTVSDYKQCTGSTTLNLNDPPVVTGTYQLGTPLKCFGEETSIAVSNLSGGAGGPYSYTIDYGVPLDPMLTSSISGGEHFITYIDKKNCEVTETITVPEPPQIQVVFDPASFEIQLGEQRDLTPQFIAVNPDSIASFVWTPASFLINPDTLYPTMYTFESGMLMLTVTDQKGCVGKGSLTVEVDLNRNIYVPNVFIAGDSEGLNRLFAPGGGIGVEKVSYMRVYNRWGELMFEQTNFLPEAGPGIYSTGWDGRFKGKFVDPGVFVYAIEVLFVDGKKLLYRGDVTVLR